MDPADPRPADTVLTTDRLRIRRLHGADAPAIASYRSDPEVARLQSWDAPYSVAQAERLIADVAGHELGALGWAQVGVVHRSSGRLIGDIGVKGHVDGTVELGYSLARGEWHRGYATEAVGAVVDHLLGPLATSAVVAEVATTNHASVALLTRLGFVIEGMLPTGDLRYRRRRPLR